MSLVAMGLSERTYMCYAMTGALRRKSARSEMTRRSSSTSYPRTGWILGC